MLLKIAAKVNGFWRRTGMQRLAFWLTAHTGKVISVIVNIADVMLTLQHWHAMLLR